MEVGGVVTLLSTTPIKGLRMRHPATVMLDRSGAAGDRDFMLVDDQRKLVSITTLGALVRIGAEWDPARRQLDLLNTDGERICSGTVELAEGVIVDCYGFETKAARYAPGPWDALFEQVVGRRLRLVKTDHPGGGSDVGPVTLMGEGSLRALERESGLGPIDPRRFRMLIQFATEHEHVEDGWEGLTLDAGGARLRVGKAVPRCAAITRHPEEGQRDLPIVSAIRAYRGIQQTGFGSGVPFGVYADVIESGLVSVGDGLRIVRP